MWGKAALAELASSRCAGAAALADRRCAPPLLAARLPRSCAGLGHGAEGLTTPPRMRCTAGRHPHQPLKVTHAHAARQLADASALCGCGALVFGPPAQRFNVTAALAPLEGGGALVHTCLNTGRSRARDERSVHLWRLGRRRDVRGARRVLHSHGRPELVPQPRRLAERGCGHGHELLLLLLRRDLQRVQRDTTVRTRESARKARAATTVSGDATSLRRTSRLLIASLACSRKPLTWRVRVLVRVLGLAHVTRVLAQEPRPEPTHGRDPGLARLVVKPSVAVRSHEPAAGVPPATCKRRSAWAAAATPHVHAAALLHVLYLLTDVAAAGCVLAHAPARLLAHRSLGNNQLAGTIPESLGSLSNLQQLCVPMRQMCATCALHFSTRTGQQHGVATPPRVRCSCVMR